MGKKIILKIMAITTIIFIAVIWIALHNYASESKSNNTYNNYKTNNP